MTLKKRSSHGEPTAGRHSFKGNIVAVSSHKYFTPSKTSGETHRGAGTTTRRELPPPSPAEGATLEAEAGEAKDVAAQKQQW